MRLGAEEIVVPDVQHALDRGQVLLERRCAEVFVHGVEPEEHVAERLPADGHHQ
jgi:hypothetical protein